MRNRVDTTIDIYWKQKDRLTNKRKKHEVTAKHSNMHGKIKKQSFERKKNNARLRESNKTGCVE